MVKPVVQKNTIKQLNKCITLIHFRNYTFSKFWDAKIRHLRKTPSIQSLTKSRLQCLSNSLYFVIRHSKANGMLTASLQ